jgi:hypothetical protein
MSFRHIVWALLLFALLPTANAQEFGSCRDAGYLSGFDERLGTASCRTLLTTRIFWRGGSVPLRVITDGATPALDEGDAEREFVRRVEQLVTRIGPAMDQFGGLEIRPVTILLTNLEYAGWHAGTHGLGAECKITYFKTATDITIDAFLFTQAHELFHCIQGVTWPALQAGRPAHWWSEGTAEYFAHVVVPNTSEGDRFINDFDERSGDTSLVDMDYPAVVFWLWLGQHREPRGVRAFIDHMAPVAERGAQLDALRSRISLEDWTAFGEAYIDSRIRQPGGRELPSNLNLGETTTITGPTRITLYSAQFVLAREVLLFKKGRSYRLSTGAVTGESRRRFQVTVGHWIDTPERVLACDSDITHVVLTTAVEGEEVSAELVVEDSERIDERACCLIGSWEPTPASKQAEIELLMGVGAAPIAAYGAQLECSQNGGGWQLVFNDGGTGAVAWDGFSYRCMVTGPKGGGGNTMTRNGSTEFEWDIVERGVGRATYTGNELAWLHVMHMGAQDITRVLPDAGPSTESNNFAFQCTDTTLSVQGIYGLNHGQGTYTRVGPRPGARP